MAAANLPIDTGVKNRWALGAVELKVLDFAREVEFYEWFGFTRLEGEALDPA